MSEVDSGGSPAHTASDTTETLVEGARTEQNNESLAAEQKRFSDAPLAETKTTAHSQRSRDVSTLAIQRLVDLLIEAYTSTCADFRMTPKQSVIDTFKELLDEDNMPRTVLLLNGDRRPPPRKLGLPDKEPAPKTDEEMRLTDLQVFPLFEALGNSFADGPFHAIEASCNNIKNEGAKSIATFLKLTTSLQYLSLRGNAIGPKGALALAEALQHQATLTELNLNTCPLGDAAVAAIADALADNRCLTKVDLGNTEAGTIAMIRLSLALEKNPTLAWLNLESPILPSLQEDSTIHLCRGLNTNTALTYLSLGKHRMRDHGAKWLAETLERKNHTLAHIDLRHNQISTSGVAALAAALAARPTPCVIELDGNPLRAQLQDEIDEVLEASHRGDTPCQVYYQASIDANGTGLHRLYSTAAAESS